ncbi:hypothetical protein OTU49_004204, partial [Cherax quadricarinatus]
TIVAPASIQCLVDLMERIVEDLPALFHSIKTSPYWGVSPRNFPHLAESSTAEPSVDQHCFAELGCLVTDAAFYHPRYRPYNLQPESREVINVVYIIYSREDPKGLLVPALGIQKLYISSFRPNRKTKILLHGYLSSRDSSWMMTFADVLLHAADYNVILVDWTDGSLGLYEQSVANARVVGLEVAYLVNWLRDNTGHQPQDVHLICYSLGAHVCGYAGERVSGLGRITGLDPAGPSFQHLPPSVRLDPTDALFVDVIHTDTSPFSWFGGYGMTETCGHLDFFPNNGRNQPGCEPPVTRWLQNSNFSLMSNAVENALVCNHMRSILLFINSIVSQCPYTAFSCQSYNHYKQGKCFSCGEDGTRCASMGLYADTWPGRGQVGLKLYLTTGPADNLCLYHFRLRIKLEKTGRESPAGHLSISILTYAGHSWSFDLTNGSPERFEHGKRYTFVVEHGEDLSRSQAVHLTWTVEGSSCSTCDFPLPLSSVSILNMEKFVQSRKLIGGLKLRSEEVVLCPGGTKSVVLVGSGDTIQLLASPTCFTT